MDSSDALRIVSIAQAPAGRTNITVRAVDSGRPPMSLQKSFSFLLLRSLGEVKLTAREVAVGRAKDASVGELSFVRTNRAVADVAFS